MIRYILIVAFFALTACSKENPPVETRVRGKVLEQGTLKPLKEDSIQIRFYRHVACEDILFGPPGGCSEQIGTLEFSGGNYQYSFMAEDRFESFFFKAFKIENGKYYFKQEMQLTPGIEQVRDILINNKTHVLWQFHDTGRFADKTSVHISWGNDLYHANLYLDSTNNYQLKTELYGGWEYHFEIKIQTLSNFYPHILEYTLEIPANDTLKMDVDI